MHSYLSPKHNKTKKLQHQVHIQTQLKIPTTKKNSGLAKSQIEQNFARRVRYNIARATNEPSQARSRVLGSFTK